MARRKEKVEELSKQLQGKQGKLHAFQADLTKESDILNVFKWTTEFVGNVHILINNAGVFYDTSLINGDTKLWRNVIDTNLMGLCIATREAVRIMNDNNIAGHIIHMNSIAGHKVIEKTNIYSPSKFAVTALTEVLRQELIEANSKIKVTVSYFRNVYYFLWKICCICVAEYKSWFSSFRDVQKDRRGSRSSYSHFKRRRHI